MLASTHGDMKATVSLQYIAGGGALASRLEAHAKRLILGLYVGPAKSSV
jgi:hypothetical protein